MMWSKLTLLLFVGLAFGAHNPAWKRNTEYVYNVRGRTLASLHEVADQYAGIAVTAKLSVYVQNDNSLYGKISEAKYAKVHTELPEGWLSQIDDSQLSYTEMPMSGKQFKIVAEHDGIITDVIVEKDVTNWEANIIKSIVSQYQLDMQGKNSIPDQLNAMPENDDSKTAVFKTMEETVTGKTETLYQVNLFPEHILAAEPWLAPLDELKADGSLMEVVKSKNFTNSIQRPMYHYGLLNVDESELASNQMGNFFDRRSESRILVSGRMLRYTIQSAYTVDKIIMSPTLNNKQKGSVISMMNVTLEKIQDSQNEIQKLEHPISLGGLVYRFNQPFSGKNTVRELELDWENVRMNSASQGRFRRNAGQPWSNQEQRAPLSEAPHSPLLPYTVGNQGNSLKQDPNFNIVQKVQEIVNEIGRELQLPKEMVAQRTLNRYTTLTALVRLMNVDELRQVAEKVYTQEKGAQRFAWVTLRDAVAEAGTGPALLIIQEWVQNDKISGEQAGQVIATAARNVRQPTIQYLRSFYDFIVSEKVMNKQSLNETGLLAITNLLRQVTANPHHSRNQYPVHSFGYFYNKDTKDFVKETVIPFLGERLRQANDQGDVRKIHVYIRALGNLGNAEVLRVFERYLEGKEQSSQFQRLMMVVAMDRLAESNPKLARNVLFRIYQNSGESQEVRAAAVYRLMPTNPPTDMLQRMAEYTHVDTNEYVNAAVKSSIEQAADLEGQEFQHLRKSAQAAKPLLTSQIYGQQYGHNFLRSYVINELKHAKNVFQTIGSDDSLLPKSIRLAVRKGRFQDLCMDAMVSSIEELTHVLERQTLKYKKEIDQQELAGTGHFSSDRIAQYLKLQKDEREQLEGHLNVDLGFIQQLWSMDNHTIEQLPSIVREYEQMLKEGKSFHYTKLINTEQIAMSFPTEMGLPFLYTYDTPIAINIEGQVQASSSPDVYSKGYLNHPEQVKGDLDLHVHVTTSKQGRLSFITPFDRQQYFSGFDKLFQVNVPIRIQAEVDIKENQVTLKVQHNNKAQENNLVHYSTWPFTAVSDITSMEPLALKQTYHKVQNRQQQQQSFEHVFGQRYTGIALKLKVQHAQKFMKILDFSKWLKGQNIPLMQLWNEDNIEHSKIDLEYLPEQTSTKKVTIRAGFQHQYNQDESSSQSNLNEHLKHLKREISEDSQQRQEDFIQKVAPGINNAHADAVDIAVSFDNPTEIEYTWTAAVAKSNSDPKANALFFFRRMENDQQQYEVSMAVQSHIENTNNLDLTEAIKVNPVYDAEIKLVYGADYESAAKMHAHAKLRRSEERKQYLLQEVEYKQCEEEMREGNRQLPACANMTTRMHLLDQFEIKLEHKNIKPEHQDIVKTIFDAVKVHYYPQVEENNNVAENGKITVEGRFEGRFEGVNVTVKCEQRETKIRNIHVPEWLRPVVSVHPVMHLRARLNNEYMGLDTYRPICVVDQNKASTFSSKVYPISLGNMWTVMFQYVPKHARRTQQEQLPVEEQLLKYQVENYAVLVRANQANRKQKDVKITVAVPESKGQYVEINLEPATGNLKAKVSVKNEQVQIDAKQSYDIENGLVQIYALPTGEVKVEIERAFYVTYDGHRAKLTTLNGKFRNAVRGLCGQFNGDDNTDFLTADNCIAQNAEDFVRSYQFNKDQIRQPQIKDAQHRCYERKVLYANVISSTDIENVNHINKNNIFKTEQRGIAGAPEVVGYNTCIKYQTRYEENTQEICFSTRPMPKCLCEEKETVTKDVQVHCVRNDARSQLWKRMIQDGDSPDFSGKPATKSVRMELPKACSK